MKRLTWVCALSAAAFIWLSSFLPFVSRRLPSNPDYLTYLDISSAAGEAIAGGQIPALEAPRVIVSHSPLFKRYPVIAFYAPLPFNLAGALSLCGMTAHGAMVGMVAAMVLAAMVGTYLLCRELDASVEAALVGAASYMCAPSKLASGLLQGYWAQDLALDMIPWVLLLSIWCLRKPSVARFLASAALWAALAMSHPIYHLLGVIFTALFIALESPRARKGAWIIPLAAYAFGACIAAWHLFPMAFLGARFEISGAAPSLWARRTGLVALLGLATPWNTAAAPGQRLGLVLLCALVLLPFWGRFRPFSRPALVCVIVTLFLVISPGPWDFWKWSGPLQHIQSPLAFLHLTDLFGAPLVACAWDGLGEDRASRFLGAALLSILLLALPSWVPMRGSFTAQDAKKFYDANGMNECSSEVINSRFVMDVPMPPRWETVYPESALSTPPRNLAEGFDWSGQGPTPVLQGATSGPRSSVDLNNPQGGTLQLPAPWYPLMDEIRVNGASAQVSRVGNRLAVELPPGPNHVEYRYRGLPWANWLSAVAAVAWLLSVAASMFKARTVGRLGRLSLGS